MDTTLGQAVQSTSTSGLWSLLDGFLKKINKKIKNNIIYINELILFLKETKIEILNSCGVYLFKTGPTFIICTNPNFSRARKNEIELNGEVNVICSCSDRIQREDKYMSSHAYNAGRHACSTVSTHKLNCPLWLPSTSSHLHSWRRGVEKTNK
jgi:hypothetical protein